MLKRAAEDTGIGVENCWMNSPGQAAFVDEINMFRVETLHLDWKCRGGKASIKSWAGELGPHNLPARFPIPMPHCSHLPTTSLIWFHPSFIGIHNLHPYSPHQLPASVTVSTLPSPTWIYLPINPCLHESIYCLPALKPPHLISPLLFQSWCRVSNSKCELSISLHECCLAHYVPPVACILILKVKPSPKKIMWLKYWRDVCL